MLPWRPDLESRHYALRPTTCCQTSNLGHVASIPSKPKSLREIAAESASVLSAALEHKAIERVSPSVKQVLWDAILAQRRDSWRLALLLAPQAGYETIIGNETALRYLGKQLRDAELGTDTLPHPAFGVRLSGEFERKHVHFLADVQGVKGLDLRHCNASADAVKALRQAVEMGSLNLDVLFLPLRMTVSKDCLAPPWNCSIKLLETPVRPGDEWERVLGNNRDSLLPKYWLVVCLPENTLKPEHTKTSWRRYFRVCQNVAEVIDATPVNRRSAPSIKSPRSTHPKVKRSIELMPSGGLARYLENRYGITVNRAKAESPETTQTPLALPAEPRPEPAQGATVVAPDLAPEELCQAPLPNQDHAMHDPLAGLMEIGSRYTASHSEADPMVVALAADTDPDQIYDSETLSKTSPAKFKFQNRYSIAPSSRWDGINRSNGFEEQYLSAHTNSV